MKLKFKTLVFLAALALLCVEVFCYLQFTKLTHQSSFKASELSDHTILIDDQFNVSRYHSVRMQIAIPTDFTHWKDSGEVYFTDVNPIETDCRMTSGGAYVTYDKQSRRYTLVMSLSVRADHIFCNLESIQVISPEELQVKSTQVKVENLQFLP